MRAAFAAAVSIGLTTLVGCREPIVTAPSLLLITTGGLRADSLACYGGASSDGLGICDLSEQGALFVWAFSTHPHTATAAASLLTSLAPSEHGVSASAATFLRSSITTLASELARAGLATAAFVAVPELNRSRNLQLGFDHYEVVTDPLPSAAATGATAAFSRWRRAHRPPEQAWFAWVHYPAVGRERLPLRPLSLAELDRQVVILMAEAQAAASRDPGSAQDSQGLQEPQDRLGVAFAALSGTSRENAAPLALERVRVPLIWMPPGGVAAQRLAAPVALLDLAPTFLLQAGLPIPTRLQGEPLRVGALPPAAALPARPLRLSTDDEQGVVLSRRFYARPLGARYARTALLPDNGAWPKISRVEVASNGAKPYEAEIATLAAPPDATAAQGGSGNSGRSR